MATFEPAGFAQVLAGTVGLGGGFLTESGWPCLLPIRAESRIRNTGGHSSRGLPARRIAEDLPSGLTVPRNDCSALEDPRPACRPAEHRAGEAESDLPGPPHEGAPALPDWDQHGDFHRATRNVLQRSCPIEIVQRSCPIEIVCCHDTRSVLATARRRASTPRRCSVWDSREAYCVLPEPRPQDRRREGARIPANPRHRIQ